MKKKSIIFFTLLVNLIVIVSTASAQMPHMPPGMMKEHKTDVELPPPDQPLIVTLDNGMEVMFIENHASPVIASIVVVRAGARNETIELNGASHYLEHLLFNGTQTRTQQQLYDEMDFLGGYNNASTRYDHTNFMILISKDNFVKGLDIQRDMLFHSTLPPEKFEKEKGIIIEEIGMDEDRESYRMDLFFDQVIYEDTPYERPVLGSRRSINQMTRDQVWDYYKTCYVPNNMTALIVGDFHTPDMLKLIQETYGQEPPRALPSDLQRDQRPGRFPKKPYWISHGRTIIRQGKASHHEIRLSFSCASRHNKTWFAQLVMQQLLQEYLESELIDNPVLVVSGVSVSEFSDRNFARLNVSATVNPGEDHEPALNALRHSLEQFREEVPDSAQVAAIITSLLSEDIYNSERPHFFGMLKSADIAAGGARFLATYQDKLEAVTTEEVAESSRMLHPHRAVTAIFQAVDIDKAKSAEVSAQKIVRRELPNGMTIIVKENSERPIFAAHFLFKHRSFLESEAGVYNGAVDFLHHVLEHGPRGMNKDEFKAELQKHGARVKFFDMSFIPFDDYYTRPGFSYIRIEAMDDDYRPVFDLVAKTLMNPNLTPVVVEPVRGRMIGLASRGQASVSKKGRALFRRTLYGDYPLAASITGTTADIESTSLEDLQGFASLYFSPQNLILTVVSGHDAEEVASVIEATFSGWDNGDAIPDISTIPPNTQPVRVDEVGGKEQSYLALGYRFSIDDPKDRAPLTILNSIISERIQFQLREREGLAYSIGSSIGFNDDWAVWAASMGTGPQNLERAEEGIMQEFKKVIKSKLTAYDIDKARNAYLGRLLLRGLTRVNQAYLMGLGEFHGEGVDRHQNWINELKEVTLEDVKRVAKQYMTTEGWTTAILR
ncbi:hypothetical protein CEE37_10060 [candidate division LCP-89 bacterium B3_LCP]|uniref:Peptidase M16 n=1 Tax=candidate division LCP-89 bacterium B3_LCP TaxID=2012998 RepID=A0A532UYT4_UNCL8|nr:MAG: hypothetical protein CEE37_10060 [candidate division LCP-89 bacterium B3_LCP]